MTAPTSKPTPDKSALAERTILSAAQNVSPLRARLMNVLAQADGGAAPVTTLATALRDVAEQELADALVAGVQDGLFDVGADAVRLTALGKRAVRALFSL